MPKNRQPLREDQQSNSLLSGAVPAASRTTWIQAEPWGRDQTARKRVVSWGGVASSLNIHPPAK